MCCKNSVSFILKLLKSRNLRWHWLTISTLWWCRLTDCLSSSVLNATAASDLYFIFLHGQMSRLFLMALGGEAEVRAGAAAPCREGAGSPSLPPRTLIHPSGLGGCCRHGGIAVSPGCHARPCASLCHESGMGSFLYSQRSQALIKAGAGAVLLPLVLRMLLQCLL